MKNTSTSAEARARAAHDNAVADLDQWRQTITQLEQDLATAEAEKPANPTDLARIADRQVSLAKQLEMARVQLGEREAAVLDAARAVVDAQADDLQASIDTEQKTVDAIDSKTAELRAAVEAHIAATLPAREQAAVKLAELRRLQDGLRAAVAGEGVREYFRTLDALPAALHPVSGLLPQASFMRDVEQIAFNQVRAASQEGLDELAAKLHITPGLVVTLTTYDQPNPAWVDELRLTLTNQLEERGRSELLAAFDRAVELGADAYSVQLLATKLADPSSVSRAEQWAKAARDQVKRMADEAAALSELS